MDHTKFLPIELNFLELDQAQYLKAHDPNQREPSVNFFNGSPPDTTSFCLHTTQHKWSVGRLATESEEDRMQTHLLAGPTPIKSCRRFSSAISGDLLPPSFNSCGRESRDLYHHRRRYRDGRSRYQRCRRKTTVISAAYSSSSWSSAGEQNHYVVLGIARNATQADVKRAYRLLARKVRPFVWDSSRF